MPLDPQLGKMLEVGFERKVLPQMLVIAAFLSIPDPRERPFEKSQAADQAHRQWASEKSDFIAALQLYDALEKLYNQRGSFNAVRRFANQNFLNYRRLREWRNLVDDLAAIAGEHSWQTAPEAAEKLLEFEYSAAGPAAG